MLGFSPGGMASSWVCEYERGCGLAQRVIEEMPLRSRRNAMRILLGDDYFRIKGVHSSIQYLKYLESRQC
jgi:hypothetical protein